MVDLFAGKQQLGLEGDRHGRDGRQGQRGGRFFDRQQPVQLGQQPILVKVAGYGDDQVVRTHKAPVEGHQMVPADGLNRRGRRQHAQRVSGVQRPLEFPVANLFRVIILAADRLKGLPAGHLQAGLIEAGMQQHLAEQLQAALQILGQGGHGDRAAVAAE